MKGNGFHFNFQYLMLQKKSVGCVISKILRYIDKYIYIDIYIQKGVKRVQYILYAFLTMKLEDFDLGHTPCQMSDRANFNFL